jgi:two-component system, cell cycle response regulator DivK
MSQTKKVLIAEDSSVIQNLTKKILQFQNFEISSAKNGQKVLDLVQNEEFDILLLDINMPIMDGMECARQIRSLGNKEKSGIPIVAITGNAKNYSEDQFKEAGIDEILYKPLDFDNLVDVVKRLTNRS